MDGSVHWRHLVAALRLHHHRRGDAAVTHWSQPLVVMNMLLISIETDNDALNGVPVLNITAHLILSAPQKVVPMHVQLLAQEHPVRNE